jgi:hypothetical protein
MAAMRGNFLAFVLFAAFFALHIVGGATDQGWLFAIAVVLIAISAITFPMVAMLLARPATTRQRALTVAIGFAAGAALTAGVFWAANDRAWAWWHWPAAIAIVGTVAWLTLQRGPRAVMRGRGSPSPG